MLVGDVGSGGWQCYDRTSELRTRLEVAAGGRGSWNRLGDLEFEWLKSGIPS